LRTVLNNVINIPAPLNSTTSSLNGLYRLSCKLAGWLNQVKLRFHSGDCDYCFRECDAV